MCGAITLHNQNAAMAEVEPHLRADGRYLILGVEASKVYLSGAMTIDSLRKVRVVSSPRQMQMCSVAGIDASLAYHPLALTLAQMSGR